MNCTPDGSLWVADTGCGYHLVPEADVTRGSSIIVSNPGARRLRTANGEVRANECVKFGLRGLGLDKKLATILPQTSRMLNIGALCIDETCTFHWPAGGTPFFTMPDGKVIWCEVYGKVPYLRTGAMALPVVPSVADLDVALAGASSTPTDAADALPPLPPLNAFLRNEAAEIENGAEHPVGEGAAVDVPFDQAPVEDARSVPPPPLAENEHLERFRKSEATSLRHLMTHHPKNSYCQTCCIAKCQRAPHRRKHHKYWKGRPRPTAFGDEITADHIVAYSERSQGITGHQAAVIFGDRATGWFDGFPIGG